MKAFVITMPVAMKSAQLCIDTAMNSSNIIVEIFPAIKPENSPRSLMAVYNLPIDLFFNKWCRPDNAMACFLSHYTLWSLCAKGEEDYLIFEHDTVITGKIPYGIPFKGVLSFGAPSFGVFNIPPKAHAVNKLISKQYFPGAHAYLVKPEAAKVLIDTAKHKACPTDVFLHNDNFDFLEEYYPWPVAVDDTFTTIQKKEGCLAKHNYRKNPEGYQIL